MTAPDTFQPIGAVAARIVHLINPRRGRDLARGRRMGEAVRAAGGGAMDAALANIDGAFNEAAVINGFKMRVERMLVLGADHPAVRAKYGKRADMLRHDDIDGAIIRVESWYRTERKAFQIASALGGGNRLSVEVLAELRLILRLIRASARRADYPKILETVRGGNPFEHRTVNRSPVAAE
jgi:hypothetical protein